MHYYKEFQKPFDWKHEAQSFKKQIEHKAKIAHLKIDAVILPENRCTSGFDMRTGRSWEEHHLVKYWVRWFYKPYEDKGVTKYLTALAVSIFFVALSILVMLFLMWILPLVIPTLTYNWLKLIVTISTTTIIVTCITMYVKYSQKEIKG